MNIIILVHIYLISNMSMDDILGNMCLNTSKGTSCLRRSTLTFCNFLSGCSFISILVQEFLKSSIAFLRYGNFIENVITDW